MRGKKEAGQSRHKEHWIVPVDPHLAEISLICSMDPIQYRMVYKYLSG